MKKYHRDYQPELSKDDNGKEKKIYRYTGDYYIFDINYVEKKKIFIKNAMFCVLYILLFILAGLVNNDGSRSLLIAVPYAFLYIPYVYLVMGTFSSLQMSEKMEFVGYDRSLGRMKRSCMGILSILLYLCIADAVYITGWGGKIALAHEIVFLFICILAFFGTAVQNAYLQKMRKKVIICRHDNEVPIGK